MSSSSNPSLSSRPSLLLPRSLGDGANSSTGSHACVLPGSSVGRWAMGRRTRARVPLAAAAWIDSVDDDVTDAFDHRLKVPAANITLLLTSPSTFPIGGRSFVLTSGFRRRCVVGFVDVGFFRNRTGAGAGPRLTAGRRDFAAADVGRAQTDRDKGVGAGRARVGAAEDDALDRRLAQASVSRMKPGTRRFVDCLDLTRWPDERRRGNEFDLPALPTMASSFRARSSASTRLKSKLGIDADTGNACAGDDDPGPGRRTGLTSVTRPSSSSSPTLSSSSVNGFLMVSGGFGVARSDSSSAVSLSSGIS